MAGAAVHHSVSEASCTSYHFGGDGPPSTRRRHHRGGLQRGVPPPVVRSVETGPVFNTFAPDWTDSSMSRARCATFTHQNSRLRPSLSHQKRRHPAARQLGRQTPPRAGPGPPSVGGQRPGFGWGSTCCVQHQAPDSSPGGSHHGREGYLSRAQPCCSTSAPHWVLLASARRC